MREKLDGLGMTPRHSVRKRASRALRVTALAISSVLVFTASAAALQYVRINSSIKGLGNTRNLVVTTPDSSPDPVDSRANQAINFLIMGTDDRDGENAELGGEKDGPPLSDTTILAHLSADRTRLDLVSIARDTKANIPACNKTLQPGEKLSAPKTEKFNEAFSIGASGGATEKTSQLLLGAACTQSTVTGMTGVNIDEIVILDFVGFKAMIDAVGGIEMEVPEAINDTKYTGFEIDPGLHHMDGLTALGYARVRHGVGDNSDTQRQPRQQAVIAALIAKATSGDVLANPASLTRFITATTASLTLSDGLDSVNEMVSLAWSAKDIDSANITFAMVPAADAGKYRVWTSEADLLWAAIKADQPITAISTAAPFGEISNPAGGEPTSPNSKVPAG